ncbi:MAG: hypothetical protein JSU85_10560 [Candidatus Zixiibacteriota bacterium]|nr:MAG: hypothetical protein JSU85_10560 [candidate division Zixibacteria bacterium]
MNIHVLLRRTLLIYIFFSFTAFTYADDSQIKAFFDSGVTYGLFGDDGLYCYPEYQEPRAEPPEDYIRPKVYKMYEERNGKDIFDLPPGYIENHIKDRVGDTVMVICSGTREYGIIDTVVYYWPEVEEGVVCVVRSLGAEISSPGYPPDIMILRKDKFYNGVFIPYVEYTFVDYSYLDLKDSLKAVMIDSYVNHMISFYDSLVNKAYYARMITALDRFEKLKETGENPFYTTSARCYGEKSDIIPDTLYMVYSCWQNSEGCWMTLLKIHKEGYQWIPQTILEPHRDVTTSIEFNCAFDLDNDGVLEYYINNSIYQFKNGELKLIHGGPFIGDI